MCVWFLVFTFTIYCAHSHTYRVDTPAIGQRLLQQSATLRDAHQHIRAHTHTRKDAALAMCDRDYSAAGAAARCARCVLFDSELVQSSSIFVQQPVEMDVHFCCPRESQVSLQHISSPMSGFSLLRFALAITYFRRPLWGAPTFIIRPSIIFPDPISRAVLIELCKRVAIYKCFAVTREPFTHIRQRLFMLKVKIKWHICERKTIANNIGVNKRNFK